MKKLIPFSILGTLLLFMTATVPLSAEPLTAQLCKEKALEAKKMFEEQGEEATFKAIEDENSSLRFGDGKGYIWVHDLDLVMVNHPIKPTLNGKDLSQLRDSNGSLFFVLMNEVCEESGQGWVPYAWPKPGDSEASPKVSFVTLSNAHGKEYIFGSGMYDVTPADIKKMFPDDVIKAE